MILRQIAFEDRDVCLQASQEVASDEFLTPFLFMDDGETWASFMATYVKAEAGIDTPADWVPATFLLAEVNGEIVGRSSIRYELNDYLQNFGGHIGFIVRPQFRRRGFATEILTLSLGITRDLGLKQVLVTCDDRNLASAAVIERCGGALENTVEQGPGVLTRRYWITA